MWQTCPNVSRTGREKHFCQLDTPTPISQIKPCSNKFKTSPRAEKSAELSVGRGSEWHLCLFWEGNLEPGGLKSWILPPSLVSEAGGMMGSPNLVPGPGNAEVTVLHPTDSRDLATLSPGASGTE